METVNSESGQAAFNMKSWQVIGMWVLLASFNFGSFLFQNQNMETEIYGL